MARSIDEELASAEARVAELRKQKKIQAAALRDEQVSILGEIMVSALERSDITPAVEAWLRDAIANLPRHCQLVEVDPRVA